MNEQLVTLRTRWDTMWRGIDHAEPQAAAAEFAALIGRYREPQRHYHVLEHIAQGLDEIAALGGTIARTSRAGSDWDVVSLPWLELAWWCHDAIYEIGVPGNEDRSAAFLREMALRVIGDPHPLGAWGGVGDDPDRDDFIVFAASLIRATTHAPLPAVEPGLVTSRDHERRATEWFLDIDLSILGQPADVFDAYERGIRLEYQTVAPELFVARRTEILAEILARGVYYTDVFRWKYLAQAEVNLLRSIRRLRTKGADAFL